MHAGLWPIRQNLITPSFPNFFILSLKNTQNKSNPNKQLNQ